MEDSVVKSVDILLKDDLIRNLKIIVYLVFVGEFKKNVTRHVWRVLVPVHSPFWRVFEKNGFPHCVSHILFSA
jgi:hypothetical protein